MDESRRIVGPLQYLPTFELVARHLSIKRAAQELHLTPSAVSQQIRGLEEAFGLPLFRRLTRALALTPAGSELAEVTQQTLDTYRRGCERLLRRRGRRTLRLSCEAFVAHEILIPELRGFRARHAGIDLRIETGAAFADLRREGLDAALRYGLGPWAGLAATPLGQAQAAAVCAPGLVQGDRLRSPRALARYPLIRLRGIPDGWERVGRALGVTLQERLVFDSYSACLRAAEKGLGIAFGLLPVVNEAVLQRRLVMPLALRLRTRANHYFVCRKEDANQPELVALRDWCAARFAALPALPEAGIAIVDEPPLVKRAASERRPRRKN